MPVPIARKIPARRNDLRRIVATGLFPFRLLTYPAHGLSSRNLGPDVPLAGTEGPNMANNPSNPSEIPEFSHVVEFATLRDGTDFDIAPTPAEAKALARLMDANSLRKMRFRGRLVPFGAKGWDLQATLGATVVQPCIVTLEPVTTRIDEPVHRRFLPAAEAAGTDDDEIEPLGDRVDLGLIATEALALA